jgi:hypothetical protein
MRTGTIAVALAIGWAGISGLASAQALGSTVEKDPVALTRVGDEATGTAGEASAAVEKMGEWLGTFDRIREGLERNDGFIRSDDELVLAFLFQPMEGESKLLRQYMKSVVVAMEAVPDTFYARLDEKVEGLWAEINRLAPTLRPVTGAEADGALRQAIEKRVIQGAPDARVVRALMSGDKWIVRMSDAGLPRSEYRKGYVMYSLPNQPLVVCQQIVVERPYFGTAKVSDDFVVKLGYLRLQSKA